MSIPTKDLDDDFTKEIRGLLIRTSSESLEKGFKEGLMLGTESLEQKRYAMIGRIATPFLAMARIVIVENNKRKKFLENNLGNAMDMLEKSIEEFDVVMCQIDRETLKPP